MITKLKVSNFKSLRELECEFGRLTVIVGPKTRASIWESG
jgi:AAA15 family ATPase/GTPase